MRLGIFVGGGNAGFQILLKFAKHFGEVDTGVVAKRRRLGSGGRSSGLGSFDRRRGPGRSRALLRGRCDVRYG